MQQQTHFKNIHLHVFVKSMEYVKSLIEQQVLRHEQQNKQTQYTD